LTSCERVSFSRRILLHGSKDKDKDDDDDDDTLVEEIRLISSQHGPKLCSLSVLATLRAGGHYPHVT
jgi:hypothetical protein